MKRREFLQNLSASAGVLALPVPAFAKVASQTVTKVVPFHYGWACVYAQMNNGVSAADIARVFRISPMDASGLMDRMLMRGVISPVGLNGRAHPTRAWEPWDKRQAADLARQDKNSAQDAPKRKPLPDLFRAMFAHVTDDPSFGWAA